MEAIAAGRGATITSQAPPVASPSGASIGRTAAMYGYCVTPVAAKLAFVRRQSGRLSEPLRLAIAGDGLGARVYAAAASGAGFTLASADVTHET